MRTVYANKTIDRKLSNHRTIKIAEFIERWQPIFRDSAVLLKKDQFESLMRSKGIYTKKKHRCSREYLNIPHPAYVAQGYFLWDSKENNSYSTTYTVHLTRLGIRFLVDTLTQSNIISLKRFEELEPNKIPVNLLRP